MVIKKANIAELKAKLSAYLERFGEVQQSLYTTGRLQLRALSHLAKKMTLS
jgi:hypothetical protein